MKTAELTQAEKEYLLERTVHNIRTGKAFYAYKEEEQKTVDGLVERHPELKSRMVLIDDKIY